MPVNVIPVLTRTKQAAEANAKVLDHISGSRGSHSPKETTTPISKQILTTIFNSLSSSRHHVCVENDQENHFLYGLVLPLVARLLAVSTPGLLVVVQLPRPDVKPQWTVPLYDNYRSNASSGSKSAAPTTPSPQGTSRTPSPSDDVPPNGRKSISPDHPRTEELIRHADKVLSKAEADKHAERENGSPPPDSVVQDHAALRLICNGFEVLTGKMPPPTHNMGAFTMASVAWEKAGVLEPETPGKAVSMSFSNGMMTPTEGIVVSFSNGSLCLLTTRDPLAGLDSLKISPDTPVVVFSFAAVGYASVSDLLAMKPDTLTPVAAKVKENLEKPNFFFVEIGHSGALSGSAPVSPSEAQPPTSQENATAEDRKENMKSDQKNQKPAANCPPILISSVPRAVPLFVNTINQSLIDQPHQDQADFESDGADDRIAERQEPSEERQKSRPPSSNHAKQSDQPVQHNDTKDNKETPTRKEFATSAPVDPTKPPAVVGSQSFEPLRPVHEVVQMSQGVPARHGHHPPVYNYPYPLGHMYSSDSQSHRVLPHHVPSIHQGQSLGTPYYVPGHPNGHGGPATPYQANGYPSSYYPQHVVPRHESWHRMPHYPHSVPAHSIDARRDMAPHYMHRADGQYHNSYYPMPQRDLYNGHHMGAPSSRSLPARPPHPEPTQPSFHGTPSTIAVTAGPRPPPPPPPAPVQVTGPGATPVGNSEKQLTNGMIDVNQEKEKALEGLLSMRTREAETMCERKSPRRRESGGNGRKGRRTETSSSTSTNSGGGALMNSPMDDHSSVKLPHQKRRKR